MKNIGHSKIAGIGAYLPSQIVTSEEIMARVVDGGLNKPLEFLSKLTGIKERRVESADVKPSVMAYQASLVALEQAGIQPDDLDAIIYCGIDRDCREPATATFVQRLLGAPTQAYSYDISNACIGFLNGVRAANAEIGIGAAENILVCTAEKLTDISYVMLDKLKEAGDKKAFFEAWLGALTFGDGAGAMVLQRPVADEGIKHISFETNANHVDLCTIQDCPDGVEFKMMMKAINKAGLQMHEKLDLEDDYTWENSALDKVYCHQTGASAHRHITNILGVGEEKVPKTYDLYGNLTSATFPVNKYLNPADAGDKVLDLGAGSGLSICRIASQH